MSSLQWFYDQLDKIKLMPGSHSNNPDKGMCIMEAVSFFTSDEVMTDTPYCVPEVAGNMYGFNDNWDDENRQKLVQFIPQFATTGYIMDQATEFERDKIKSMWAQIGNIDGGRRYALDEREFGVTMEQQKELQNKQADHVVEMLREMFAYYDTIAKVDVEKMMDLFPQLRQRMEAYNNMEFVKEINLKEYRRSAQDGIEASGYVYGFELEEMGIVTKPEKTTVEEPAVTK